jgi:hypothetical protein
MKDMEHPVTRRRFLLSNTFGLGTAALFNLLGESGLAAGPLQPHFPATAKNVIFLFMDGGPSHVDLFDHKPKLTDMTDQPVPESFTKGAKFAFVRGTPRLLGSPYKFSKHGGSGAEISELLPHLTTVVDDIAIVRSMVTTQINHAPAQLFMNTGHEITGRPSVGSWVAYGLGSENRDLPEFVVLVSGTQPSGGKSCWGTGFLPTRYQGVEFRTSGEPVLFAANPRGVDAQLRRQSVDAIRDLNQITLQRTGDPEIETRIAAYELAFRMQSSVPELADVSSEPASVRDMYGVGSDAKGFAAHCLLARRLIERGVRFVQVYQQGWDMHGTSASDDLVAQMPKVTRTMDQPVAALIRDLKQRGLLDSTLVIWGGEFGRTPMNEKRDGSRFIGRDHHPYAFTMWLAGGGVRPGAAVGRTDELGFRVVEDPVHVHDLHATLLHLLGVDHTRLTYRFQGRDFRLTDVSGEVVRKLLK